MTLLHDTMPRGGGVARPPWTLAVSVVVLFAAFLIVSGCAADEERPDGGAMPIVAVWQPSIQRGRMEAPRLRYAVWPNGQVAFSRPVDSFSMSRLQWGWLSPGSVRRLKQEIVATRVLDLTRQQYLLWDGAEIRMFLRLDEKEIELRWDEGPSKASAFAAEADEYRKFREVWRKINQIIVLYLPTNAVTLDREWRSLLGLSGRKPENGPEETP